MSWIYGLIGNFYSEDKEKLNFFDNKKIFSIEENRFYLIAGGNPKTMQCKKLEDSSFNIFAGVSIFENNNSYKIGTIDDFKDFSVNDLNKINGHFLLLEIREKYISAYTDELGLRDIYFHKLNDDLIAFGTNQGYLKKLFNLEIDFNNFGSKWNFINQFSNKSILKNTVRIVQGRTIKIHLDNLNYEIKNNYWLPKYFYKENSNQKKFNQKEIIENFENELRKITIFPIENGQTLNLSLSGGFDSRVLFSILTKYAKNERWETHSFGKEYYPDVKIAKILSDKFSIKHNLYNFSLPEKDSLIEELKNFSKDSMMNTRLSEYLQLKNYQYLVGKDEIVIDGGFGEICRRGLLRKVLFFHKRDLLNGDFQKVLPIFKSQRADIFIEELNSLMNKSGEEELINLLNFLPAINLIGVENFVDLLTLKTKMLNISNPAQVILDGLIQNFMPFVQKNLLEILFTIDIKQRNNGKMLRKIIKSADENLTKIPLARGNEIYPFNMNIYGMKIRKYLNKILHKNAKDSYLDNLSELLISYLKDEILDLLNSENVKSNPIFKKEKIQSFSNNLFKDNLTSNELYELDWFLSYIFFNL